MAWLLLNIVFKKCYVIDGQTADLENTFVCEPEDLTDDVNIGSGDGLVPLGTKPSPDLMVTMTFKMWHYQAPTN